MTANLPKHGISHKLPLLALFILMAGLIFLRVLEISQTAQAYVFFDVWRHTATQIMPIVEGDGTLGLLWYNMHANPSLTLHQLFSFTFLDFDLSKDFYLMLGLNVLMTSIIIRFMFRWQRERPDKAWQFYVLIAVLLIYLLGAKHNDHLMALHNYPFFFGTILALFVDRYTRENKWPLRRYMVIFALVLITLFSHYSYGYIFCIAAFLASSSFMLLHRNKANLILPLILLGVMIPYGFLVHVIKSQYSYVSHSPEIMPLTPALEVLDNWNVWYELVTTFPIRMTSAVAYDVKSVQTALSGLDQPVLLILFAALFAVFIAGLIFIIIKSKRPGGIFFLAMFFTGLVITATLPLSFRWGSKPLQEMTFGLHYQHMYRYAACGLVLIIWAGLLELSGRKRPRGKRSNGITAVILLGVSALFLGLKETEIHKNFDNKSKINSQRELALYMYAQEENEIDFVENDIIRYRLHETVLPFLSKHKVNIFSPDYGAEKELRSLKQAKRIIASTSLENFQINAEQPTIKARGNYLCFELKTSDQKHNILKLTVEGAPRRLGGGFWVVRDKEQVFRANIYTGRQVFYVIFEPQSAYRACVHKDADQTFTSEMLTR